jgi:uncharacterized RDD family membrane protein YckC
MPWYYANDGVRSGPVEDLEFQDLIQNGHVRATTLVWTQGMGAWKPFSQVADAIRLPPPLPGVSPAPVSVGSTLTQPAFAAVYGGFWERVGARLIDGFIVWFTGQVLGGLVVASLMPNALQSFAVRPGDAPTPEQMAVVAKALIIIFGVTLAVGLVYDLVFLRMFSATPGKMVLGLKIKTAQGAPLSVLQIIGRHFAQVLSGLVLGIGYLLAAFDPEKRALHDHICGIKVGAAVGIQPAFRDCVEEF